MGIGKLALRALEWLGRIIGLVQTPLGKQFTRTILGRVLGDRAPHMLAKLAELEAGVGAHTSAWPKIEAASKQNTELVLTPEEADYLNRFKEIWDKHVKKPMDKAAIKLQATPPSESELEIVAIANEILADEPEDE